MVLYIFNATVKVSITLNASNDKEKSMLFVYKMGTIFSRRYLNLYVRLSNLLQYVYSNDNHGLEVYRIT